MPRLTKREREVLELYIQAGTTNAVGAQLGISPQTVKNHLYDARKRNQVRKTAQLVWMLAQGAFDE